ncbi:MAG: RNA methyltransferase [Nitrospinales bacterium]
MESNAHIHLALIHFPVYNKNREIVASSVTTLDVHDIARACKTYGVGGFYIVTPLAAQRLLVERIVQHWKTGYGAQYNSTRTAALLNTRVESTLDAVVRDIADRFGEKPRTIVTDATAFPRSVGYGEMRQLLAGPEQNLLMFGTGWGLERGVVQRADYLLAPIPGNNGYNHLPVRAAIAIILDRLLSNR